MEPNPTSIVGSAHMYDRMRVLVERAGISMRELSEQSGVPARTLYHLKFREAKGGATWGNDTLSAISATLAPKIGRRPSEVLAYLAGLEEFDLSPRST